MAIVRDHRNEVRRELERRLESRLLAAAAHLEGAVKRDLSVGQQVRRTRGGHRVGLNPSQPGQPPHVLTGRLRQSITHRVDRDARGFVARVGTNVAYSKFLELGTRKMAARPYLRPALFRERSRIAGILARGK